MSNENNTPAQGFQFAESATFINGKPTRVFTVVPSQLDLPTPEEIYDEAIFQRSYNTAQKLKRITAGVCTDVRNLLIASEAIYRAKLELEVLLVEIDEDIAEELANKDNEFNFTHDHTNPYDDLKDAEEALKHVGIDLQEAYTRLKAVFDDIDNERPDRNLYSEEQLERLAKLIAPEPGLKKCEKAKFEKSVAKPLKNKDWSPEMVAKLYFQNVSPQAKYETLSEYTKYYNSDQQL